MRTCLKVTEAIEKKQFDRLSFIDRLRVRLHLMLCPNCRQYVKDSKSIDRMLSASYQKPPTVQFTPEEKQALVNRIAR